jgi:transposase
VLVAALAASQDTVQEMKGRLQQAEWHIRELRRTLYGPASERVAQSGLSTEQALLALFPPPAEPPATADVVLPEAPAQPAAPVPAPVRTPRQPALRELETVTERIEPTERNCPHCGRAKCEIGCERSERFEYIPARVIRHEIVRPQLACPCGQGKVSIAPLPPAPIAKGLPGPGLLAQILLAKYDDHLPLYRQEKQFARLGVCFPRQTLSDWVAQSAELLQLLVHRLKQRLLQSDYLQVDETPVKVQDPELKGKCATGYLWVLGKPGGDVLFEFHTGRGKVHARELLPGFQRGYLQRDGYSVYGSLARDHPGIRPVGCGAHLRRKFFDALADNPVQAGWFVAQWRQLYLIERHAREQQLNPEQRLALRTEKAAPIVAAMKARLDELVLSSLLPQSPLGKALRYAREEWSAWTTYLEDGRLEIDNNLTENALRPACLGKKNWLFLGHPEAGWRSAVIYTLIASCRRRKLDPWAYLSDVLRRLPSMTNQEIDVLLPENWTPTVKEPAA